MKLLTAIWRVIRNPALATVDDDDQIIERWRVDRAEQWAISRPFWTYTFLTRKASCGCTRRWWGTWTLYVSDCPKHMAEMRN